MDLGHMNIVLKWMYLYVGSVFRMWNVVLKWSICMFKFNVEIVIICRIMIILMFYFCTPSCRVLYHVYFFALRGGEIYPNHEGRISESLAKDWGFKLWIIRKNCGKNHAKYMLCVALAFLKKDCGYRRKIHVSGGPAGHVSSILAYNFCLHTASAPITRTQVVCLQ